MKNWKPSYFLTSAAYFTLMSNWVIPVIHENRVTGKRVHFESNNLEHRMF